MAATKKRARLAKLPTLPKVPGLPNLNPSASLPPIIRGPRGSVVKATPTQPTEIPMWFRRRYPQTTLLEFRIFDAFLRRGDKPGEQFVYQTPEFGGREYFGGTLVDFLYIDTWPYLAIPANGNYWHYLRGFKIMDHDLMLLRKLQQERGYDVIVIDEDDVNLMTAVYVLHLALDLRVDISQYATRI